MKYIDLSQPIYDGTHINVPRHIDANGKTLSEYSIADFISEAQVYSSKIKMNAETALIFVDHDITMDIAKQIVQAEVKLVGLANRFDFNLEAERYLLEEGIISYEKLANTDQLPKDITFTFCGIPLNIKEADGAPVRAFAEVA